MGSIKNGFKIGFTIIGTTIGAGFASGRELWEFFASYGLQSIMGILIAILLFAISSIFILWISYNHKTENYYELLVLLMGEKVAKIFDYLIFLYLFSASIVMFAGSGATFKQWDLPFVMGVLVLAVFSWVVLAKGVNGLINMNSLLIPLLVYILIYITLKYIGTHLHFSGHYINSDLKVWPSAITYAALNVVSLIGVLSTLGKSINKKTEIVLGGLIATVVLGAIAILINISLLRVEFVQQYEIPLFSLVPIGKPFLMLVISLILWFAIYTTVLSNLHGLVHRVQKKLNMSAGKVSLLIILAVLPLTSIGFSTLVNILYPIYGVLNLYVLAVLILYPFQT